jgi:CheY-like chemotaxis protein
VNEQNFDIILMDVEYAPQVRSAPKLMARMPQMNGITAASEIRKQEAAGDLTGRTPIIAVTGNARKEYVDKGSSTCCRY